MNKLVKDIVERIEEQVTGDSSNLENLTACREILLQFDFTQRDFIMIAGYAMTAFENLDGQIEGTNITRAIYNIVSTCLGRIGGTAKQQDAWRKLHGIKSE